MNKLFSFCASMFSCVSSVLRFVSRKVNVDCKVSSYIKTVFGGGAAILKKFLLGIRVSFSEVQR